MCLCICGYVYVHIYIHIHMCIYSMSTVYLGILGMYVWTHAYRFADTFLCVHILKYLYSLYIQLCVYVNIL